MNKNFKSFNFYCASLIFALITANKFREKNNHLSISRDEDSNIFLIGDGFGNLFAAFYLLEHVRVSGNKIKIYTMNNSSASNFIEDFNFININNSKNLMELYENIDLNGITIPSFIKNYCEDEKFLLLNLLGDRKNFLSIDLSSKNPLLDILIGKAKNISIEKHFSKSNFLRSDFYKFISILYNIKDEDDVLKLREPILEFFSSKSFKSLNFKEVFYEPLKNYLIKNDVCFIENSFLDIKLENNNVSKLIFEKNKEVIEETVTPLDLVIFEEINILEKNLCNTKDFSYKIFTNKIPLQKGKNYLSKRNDRIYFSITFKNNLIINHLEKKFNSTNIIFKNNKIIIYLKNKKIYADFINTNSYAIFTDKKYSDFNQEEFLNEIIRLLGEDEKYVLFRENLEKMDVKVLKTYIFDYGFYLNNINNLAIISNQNNYFSNLKNLENLAKISQKIVHETFSINHLDILKKDKLKKHDIFNNIRELLNNDIII